MTPLVQPCGLNLAILYLPLPSGFLSLLSVFAKWLHTYMCLQSPVQQNCRPGGGGGGGGISDILFTYYLNVFFLSASLLKLQFSMSSILAAFTLKSPPRWERWICFFFFFFFTSELREWKSRPISLLTWTRGKTTSTRATKNSLQLQERDLWFWHIKGGARSLGCRGSQGREHTDLLRLILIGWLLQCCCIFA